MKLASQPRECNLRNTGKFFPSLFASLQTRRSMNALDRIRFRQFLCFAPDTIFLDRFAAALKSAAKVKRERLDLPDCFRG